MPPSTDKSSASNLPDRSRLQWAWPALICSSLTAMLSMAVSTAVYRHRVERIDRELHITRQALNETTLQLAEYRLRLNAEQRRQPATAPTPEN